MLTDAEKAAARRATWFDRSSWGWNTEDGEEF